MGGGEGPWRAYVLLACLWGLAGAACSGWATAYLTLTWVAGTCLWNHNDAALEAVQEVYTFSSTPGNRTWSSFGSSVAVMGHMAAACSAGEGCVVVRKKKEGEPWQEVRLLPATSDATARWGEKVIVLSDDQNLAAIHVVAIVDPGLGRIDVHAVDVCLAASDPAQYFEPYCLGEKVVEDAGVTGELKGSITYEGTGNVADVGFGTAAVAMWESGANLTHPVSPNAVLAVGAPGENGGEGAVYIYQVEPVLPLAVNLLRVLRPAADLGASGFGKAVAMVSHGRSLLVGAPGDASTRGRAFLWSDVLTGEPTVFSPTCAGNCSGAGDGFGADVALLELRNGPLEYGAVVGSPGASLVSTYLAYLTEEAQVLTVEMIQVIIMPPAPAKQVLAFGYLGGIVLGHWPGKGAAGVLAYTDILHHRLFTPDHWPPVLPWDMDLMERIPSPSVFSSLTSDPNFGSSVAIDSVAVGLLADKAGADECVSVDLAALTAAESPRCEVHYIIGTRDRGVTLLRAGGRSGIASPPLSPPSPPSQPVAAIGSAGGGVPVEVVAGVVGGVLLLASFCVGFAFVRSRKTVMEEHSKRLESGQSGPNYGLSTIGSADQGNLGEVSSASTQGLPSGTWFTAFDSLSAAGSAENASTGSLVLPWPEPKRGVEEAGNRDLSRESKNSSRRSSVARAGSVQSLSTESRRSSLAPKGRGTVFDVPFNELILGKRLDKGSFKTVYSGTWGGTKVAVSMVSLEMVKHEVAIMANLSRHPNLVTMYGLSHCDDSDETYMVMELLPLGSLNKLMHSRKVQWTLGDRLQISIQICAGLAALHKEGVVHADVAARNVFCLSTDPVTVKVGDFGLSKVNGSVYYGQHEKIPYRWSAPEVLKKGKYTEKSDVWAYGITLWEVYTDSDVPYGYGRSNKEVTSFVMKGGTLSRPEMCPLYMWEIMLSCWAFDEDDRPTFRDLRRRLDMHLRGQILPALQPQHEVEIFRRQSSGTERQRDDRSDGSDGNEREDATEDSSSVDTFHWQSVEEKAAETYDNIASGADDDASFPSLGSEHKSSPRPAVSAVLRPLDNGAGDQRPSASEPALEGPLLSSREVVNDTL